MRGYNISYRERNNVRTIADLQSVSDKEARYDFFSLRNLVRQELGFNERGCEEDLVSLGFDIPIDPYSSSREHKYCDYWHYQVEAIFRRRPVTNDSANSIYVGTKNGINYKKLKVQPNEWQKFFLEKWNEMFHSLADEHGWIKVVMSW